MKGICSECGDNRPLNRDGVCKWRHGCEHRQFVHEATMARLTDEMDRQSWHNAAQESIRQIYRKAQMPWNNTWDGEWGGSYDGTSIMQFWKARHPSQTNRWVDRMLHEDDEDED